MELIYKYKLSSIDWSYLLMKRCEFSNKTEIPVNLNHYICGVNAKQSEMKAHIHIQTYHQHDIKLRGVLRFKKEN